jgi:hypothetical protein
MDDRFDVQLVTGEFLDGEGLSYSPGSYHVLGNNNTHQCCNFSISTGSGAAPAVLAALETASDHLPVIADYQLPAILEADIGIVPESLAVGQLYELPVTVRNAANVLSALGADELDYAGITSGDLIGMFSGTGFALGGANSHLVALDTSSPGLKSGIITVSSNSQAAANAFVQFPVSFTVVSAPEPASCSILAVGVATFAGTYRRRRRASCRRRQAL